MRLFYSLFLVFICTSAFSQDKKEALYGNVISGSAFTVGNLTSSSLNKFDTRWLQLPGYGFTVGGGIQLNMSNSWAVEADFAYEKNIYVYDRADLRLNLGYSAPYIDIKVSKLFSKNNSRPNFWYVKGGVGYHLFNGQTSNADENAFEYSLELTDQRVITFMPEIGRHLNFAGNGSMQFGLIWKYSPNNVFTANLKSSNELNSAIGMATGSYVGLTLKYFHGFFSIGEGNKGSNGGDPKVRIEI